MRKPQKPPSLHRHIPSPERFQQIAAMVPDHRSAYLHWDKLRRHPPPGDLSHEEWWFALKLHRSGAYQQIPLEDTQGRPFVYTEGANIPERLHRIDLGAGGTVSTPDPITNPETQERYYVSSLMEEAITSSQLEGAATTSQIAKDMLRTGRPARDRSEQMIVNNYRTMRRLRGIKDQPLTLGLLLDIHQMVTHDTLRDATAEGRFRTAEDGDIAVVDENGELFHVPPSPASLGPRIEKLCAFANGDTPGHFVHPAIRAIVVHFWLAYDHPFVDGNGRTARALFYWSMLRHGYWLFEYISISRILLRSRRNYSLAYLYTESDDNDLTYFIVHQLDVIHEAMGALHEYLDRKGREVQALVSRLKGTRVLNHRQRALIGHALRHPGQHYSVESHRHSHDVVKQTARADLLDLGGRGLLEKTKIGRAWYFTAVSDLERRLRNAPGEFGDLTD